MIKDIIDTLNECYRFVKYHSLIIILQVLRRDEEYRFREAFVNALDALKKAFTIF